MTIKAPVTKAHHLIHFVYNEMMAQEPPMQMAQLIRDSGVAKCTVWGAFNNTRNITVRSMDAILGAVGYTTKPTPIERKKSGRHNSR